MGTGLELVRINLGIGGRRWDFAVMFSGMQRVARIRAVAVHLSGPEAGKRKA